MVLVDTSVWIRYFADQAPYAAGLQALLQEDQVAGHDLIHGELLIGDRGGRGKFLAVYERMQRARPVPHGQVVALVLHRRLNGRGVGWVDVHLLASAMAERMQFWTADVPLAAIAEELGVAYK